jgi:hypothetical protein
VVFGEQVTVVVDAARSITNDDCAADEPSWFASPAYDAFAVAVPASVFDA